MKPLTLADIHPCIEPIPWREWQAEQDRLAKRAHGRTAAEQRLWEDKHPISTSSHMADLPRTMRPKPKEGR